MNISEIGDISSIAGLAISVITLVVAYYINNEVKKIQYSNLFDRRINKHLTDINELQIELIHLIDNVEENEIKIKEILAKHLAIFESLLPKIQDKIARKKTKSLIKKIGKSYNLFFYNFNRTEITVIDRITFKYKLIINKMISSREILDIYIRVNENYNRIEQVKLDKKVLIK